MSLDSQIPGFTVFCHNTGKSNFTVLAGLHKYAHTEIFADI